MKKLKFIFLTFIAIVILSSFRQDNVITIFMIGDSTMANKDISNGKQERGWGMVLQCYFDDGIRIDNHAMNGRSSKSFITEGRWERVLEKMRPGDYVIIQFGHNDEKPKADRHTDPGSTFDYNLSKFVREARERGGIPILMNAVVRRNFLKAVPKNDDDEALRSTVYQEQKQTEGDTLVDTHGMYIVSPVDVAKRMNAHFVNANQLTHDLEQGLGMEQSKKLHMWFLPGEEPSIPNGRQDNTHYSIYGAHIVAKILADAIAQEVPALNRFRVDYDIAVDRRGWGNFIDMQKAVDAVPKGKETTIQVLGGEWQKPNIPKGKKVKFILRQGAKWKE
jgi:pectinesterase